MREKSPENPVYDYHFYIKFLKENKWIEKINVIDNIIYKWIAEDSITFEDLKYITKGLKVALYTSNIKLLYKALKLTLILSIKFEDDLHPYFFSLIEPVIKALTISNPLVKKVLQDLLSVLEKKVFLEENFPGLLFIAIERTNHTQALISLAERIIYSWDKFEWRIENYYQLPYFIKSLRKLIDYKVPKVKEMGELVLFQIEQKNQGDFSLNDIPEWVDLYNLYVKILNSQKKVTAQKLIQDIIDELSMHEPDLDDLKNTEDESGEENPDNIEFPVGKSPFNPSKKKLILIFIII